MKFIKLFIAIIKSITWVSLIFIAYVLYAIPLNFHDVGDLISHLLVYILLYLAFSIVGWLVIGIPVHTIILKWGNKNYFLYPLIAFIVVVLFFLYAGIDVALVYGMAALLQASIFSYYVSQSKT